jgi:hypothetical protein
MAYKTRVLVVANRTADSEGLAHALSERPDAADAAFTLLVPATGRGPDRPRGLVIARSQLKAGLARLRDAGLDVTGTVGDPDPIVAVAEAWKPGDFDEVIVSTLEGEASRWLEFDLPHRIGKLTDCPVQHVVPARIERELARTRFRRPLRTPPRRSLGPFAGPSG